MSAILWNYGERSLIAAWLQGDSTYAPAVGATGTSGWGLGLGCRATGVGTTKADTITQIIELDNIGAASGYGRAHYDRTTTATGWPTTGLLLFANSYQATAAELQFTFGGTPNPQGANLWFIAKDTVLNHDNACFGVDLAVKPRNFGAGDVEKVTPTYRQQ